MYVCVYIYIYISYLTLESAPALKPGAARTTGARCRPSGRRTPREARLHIRTLVFLCSVWF